VFVFASFGPITYWIGGLALTLFVGPAQAASRTFVARFTPDGREGEAFGLYQTTGRAVSFISPTLWTVSISIALFFGVSSGESAIYGVLGLLLVLVVGLLASSSSKSKPRS
jgi:MFS transporter, UMF1 family